MKRSLDIVLSVFLLAALLPLLFILSVLVRINLGSPILFRQQRAGLFARPFTMLKFRTMGTARDKDGNLLSDAERMTQFGQSAAPDFPAAHARCRCSVWYKVPIPAA